MNNFESLTIHWAKKSISTNINAETSLTRFNADNAKKLQIHNSHGKLPSQEMLNILKKRWVNKEPTLEVHTS